MMKLITRRLTAAAAALLMICTINTSYGGSVTGISAYAASSVSAPVSNTEEGEYTSTKYVRLSTSTSGATIYYTLDGSKPTENSTKYVGFIRLDVPESGSKVYRIRAVAVLDGEFSSVSEFSYTIYNSDSSRYATGITLASKPVQTVYELGEALKLDGAQITVNYNDGTTKNIDVTSGMVSGFNSATSGTKTVTVSYSGFTTSFSVTVNSADEEKETAYVTGISVTSDPDKKVYEIGQALNLSGAEITVKYSDGTSKKLSVMSSMVSGFSSSAAGAKTVTVTYEGFIDSFSVTVRSSQDTTQEPYVTGIAIKTKPKKTEYNTGEQLSLTGGVLTVYYSDGSKKNTTITSGMISGFSSASAGTKQVKVSYEGYTTSFTVTVVKSAEDTEQDNNGQQTQTPSQSATRRAVSISILTRPRKLDYEIGEKLDTTGGMIYVHYDNGTKSAHYITESMVSGFSSKTLGTKTVKVSYDGFTDYFFVEIVESTGDKNNSGSTATGGTSSGSHTSSSGSSEAVAKQETDPRLAGTEASGWQAIQSVLELKYDTTHTVYMNKNFTVPASLLRVIRRNRLTVNFEVDGARSWRVDSSLLTGVNLQDAGLGVRISAVYIPKNYITALGGHSAGTLHVNSDNKYNATLNINVGAAYNKKYASLYRYDHTDRSMTLVDTYKVGTDGMVEFVPDKAGDYVIIMDSKTRIVGDVNNDAILTATDYNLLRNIVMRGMITRDERADINGDGKLTMTDVLLLFKMVNR